MITYKMFRLKKGKLYPLYVEADREMPLGIWLDAHVGEKVDEMHVKARALSRLALRPGFHSTKIPFTDWIGKRQPDGTLAQRKEMVWCECMVEGRQYEIKTRFGSRELLDGWYYFKTNTKQKEPWIISNRLKINRILTNAEVAAVCRSYGIEPQKVEE